MALDWGTLGTGLLTAFGGDVTSYLGKGLTSLFGGGSSADAGTEGAKTLSDLFKKDQGMFFSSKAGALGQPMAKNLYDIQSSKYRTGTATGWAGYTAGMNDIARMRNQPTRTAQIARQDINRRMNDTANLVRNLGGMPASAISEIIKKTSPSEALSSWQSEANKGYAGTLGMIGDMRNRTLEGRRADIGQVYQQDVVPTYMDPNAAAANAYAGLLGEGYKGGMQSKQNDYLLGNNLKKVSTLLGMGGADIFSYALQQGIMGTPDQSKQIESLMNIFNGLPEDRRQQLRDIINGTYYDTNETIG